MPPLDNDRRERFVQYLVAGHPDPDTDTLGNATAAYQAVYDCKRGSAQSGGHRLMTTEAVRARVRELREELAEQAMDRAKDWRQEVPRMQQVIIDVAAGKYAHEDDNGRARLQAAIHWLDRHYGTVREMHELQVQGQAIIARVAGPPHSPPEERENGDQPAIKGRAVEATSREHGQDQDQADGPDLLEWWDELEEG